MWVPKAVADWFQIAKDSVDALREENAALKSEVAVLRVQLATSQNHFDWLRVRVNSIEAENAALREKAFGIKLPVPEIVRTAPDARSIDPESIFQDMGDDMARKLGLPVYDK